MDDNLKNISDGRLYGANDMVKIGCQDCKGCSQCCQDMGDSILLDPMDIYRLEKNLNMTFEGLLAGPVTLHVEDGLIMPNLKMMEYKTDENGNSVQVLDKPQCSFLNEQGRCQIHAFRPGICRLFPLGRNYEGDKLTYFVLSDACPAKNKTKVKISKWLEAEHMKEYQEFLVKWHSLTKKLRIRLQELNGQDELVKQVNMLFLQIFYMQTYRGTDFYSEFEARLAKMHQLVDNM